MSGLVFHVMQAPTKLGRKRNMSLEAQVSNILKENDTLRLLTAYQVDVLKVHGFTLRERMTRDKADVIAGRTQTKFGKTYYTTLKDTYCDEEAPEKRLRPHTLDCAIDPKLFSAMIQSKKSPPNRKPLMCYFAMVAEVRQEELVGIFKFALQCNPRAAGGEQRLAVVEVLKMCARLNLQDKFSEELSIMMPHFTKTMLEVTSAGHCLSCARLA